MRFVRIAAIVLVFAGAAAAVDAAEFPFDTVRGIPSLAPVVEPIRAGVVSITTAVTAATAGQFGFGGGQPGPNVVTGAGSGVIIDAAKGYIVTNSHVVSGADVIAVTLQDGRTIPARLIGSDRTTDIALLQIEGAGALTALPLGDVAGTKVGDLVLAIGNPFDLGQTVTMGIVSAMGRGGLGIDAYEDFIQTDAPINPGNSGGALVDVKGRLIGINSAIIGGSGGNVGIGFAVPITVVTAVMRQLVEFGSVLRGQIGIVVADQDPEVTAAGGGALVRGVDDPSNARTAGIAAGDVVVAFNGDPIRDGRDFRNHVALTRPGTTMALTIRRNGQRFDAVFPLAPVQLATLDGAALASAFTGATLTDIDPNDPESASEGIRITVQRNSLAARNGLRSGDILIGINERRVRSLAELKIAAPTGSFIVTIVRNGQVMSAIVG